jgi:hypothetical protein
VILTIISEVTYGIDTGAIGHVVGGARVEDGVVDEDVDDGVEELDVGDVEVDSVTAQEHALESLEADDEQALANAEGVEMAFPVVRHKAAKRRGSNWTVN